MNIRFLDRLLGRTPHEHGQSLAVAFENDPEGVAELLSECELLRSHASAAGLELDDTPASLTALDQLLPRWRDDPEALPWLGNDAGLYLGTVVVRTVPGATWHVWSGGSPVVRLASGREIPVVEAGLDWAVQGVPELSQVYAEAAEA
ncbi:MULTISPECIES: DUF6278 family protein [Streptomyces]|uniref:DUF6278 family protein n=1 Tax=Streptomyces TaxID=1883 RepID=UPI000BB32396|nr:DUF6278 family protein [Streptomyces sp. Tue6028]PBC60259.1 hypothetical protein BKI49_30020 [Streptomyces sp. Tue6028]